MVTCSTAEGEGVCIICKEEEPRNLSKARRCISAKKKKKVVDWLECSVCKNWVHPICSGINKSNLTKIGKSFFKCVLCCLKVTVRQCPDFIESEFGECQSKRNSQSEQSNEGKKGGVEIEDSTITETTEVVDNPTESREDGLPNEGREEDEILIEPENEEGAREKIIVIDAIKNSKLYTDSKYILREIKKYCTSLTVDYAYALAKGGVSIHLKSKKDRDVLFEALPAEAFGGGTKKKLSTFKKESVFLKEIDTKVSLKEIETKLRGRNS